MPIYKGNTKIVKLYKGNTQIVKRYKGTDLIYSVSRLPAEFQEVEYIESTGTQYIDSGYQPTLDFGIDIIFAPNSTPSSGSRINSKIFGSSKLNRGLWGGVLLSTYETYSGGQLCWFQPSVFYNPKIQGTQKQEFKVIGNNITYCDGTTGTITKDTVELINGNIYICSINCDSSLTTSGCKIYSCKLYDSTTLVRNFVPCYRKADNVAGLYDLVNGVFYTNAGTGTFIVGGNV